MSKKGKAKTRTVMLRASETGVLEQNGTVLVISGRKNFKQDILDILQRGSCRLIFAKNANEAHQILSKQKVHTVLKPVSTKRNTTLFVGAFKSKKERSQNGK